MSTTSLLAHVRIASPCSARWEDMTGDERVRFCAQCQKHVYHLSAMTAGEAEALIREKEGKLCVRFYRRRDGTMLTADCPVGAMQFVRRLRTLAAASVALVFAYFVALATIQSSFSPRSARRKVGQRWGQVVVAFNNWINPPPPAPAPLPPIPGAVAMGEMMGKLCPIPVRQTNSAIAPVTNPATQ